MKSLFLMASLVCLLSLVQTAKAQPPAGMEQGKREEMKKKADELKAKLNLSEPQAAKYDEILKRNREEARTKMMALPEDAPRSERGEIMKKYMEAADSEIFEILDTDQQTIYKAEKEKMKTEMAEKRKEKKKGKVKG